MNLASLGVKTRLIGAVGDDAAARTLEELLAAQGIDCDFARVSDRPTITKTRVQSRGQQLIRLDQENAAELRDSALVENVGKAAAGAGAVILSDYGKGALTDVREMIGLCRNAGVPVLVDPKGRDFEKYRGATLLTPNIHEFEAVVGACDSEKVLVEKGQGLLRELEPLERSLFHLDGPDALRHLERALQLAREIGYQRLEAQATNRFGASLSGFGQDGPYVRKPAHDLATQAIYRVFQKKGVGAQGAEHVKVFGGGGGVIVPEEIVELEDYGVTKIFSPLRT